MRLDVGIREKMPRFHDGELNGYGIAIRISLPDSSGPIELWDPLLALPTTDKNAGKANSRSLAGELRRTSSGSVNTARGGSAADQNLAGAMAVSLENPSADRLAMRSGRCALVRPKTITTSGKPVPETVGIFNHNLPFSNRPFQVYRSGNTFIMDRIASGHLIPVDLTEVTQPKMLAETLPVGALSNATPRSGFMENGTLFQVPSSQLIHAFSTANPLSPWLLASVGITGATINQINARKGVLGAATSTGVRFFRYGMSSIDEVSDWNITDGTRRVVIDDGLAYAMQTRIPPGAIRGPTALYVLDISNLVAPRLRRSLSDISFPGVGDVTYLTATGSGGHGALLHANMWSPGLLSVAMNGLTWGHSESGVALIDVSLPDTPQIVANLAVTESTHMTRIGRYLFMTGHYHGTMGEGIHVFDMANIKNPRHLAFGWVVHESLPYLTTRCGQGPSSMVADPRGFLIISCTEVDNRLVVVDVRRLLDQP